MSQIERCLDILESLHANPAGIPLSHLSEQLGMPKSAVHRLLAALKDRGYVEQIEESGIYRATLKLSLIGAKYFSTTDLRGFLEPVIGTLSHKTQELTRMSLLVGDELLWVLSSQGGDHTLRYDGHSGRKVVPHITATGRVWLASMSDEDAVSVAIAAGLGKPEMKRPGTKGVETVQALLKELERTRKQGYGLVEEEAEVGVSSIACPIHDEEDPDRFLGTISVAGPSVRMTRKTMVAMLPDIRETARQLSTVLFRYRVFCGSLTDPSIGALSPNGAETGTGTRAGLRV